MKTILVPTDFSTCANNAIDFAVQSAKIFPASLILLHALDIDGNNYTDYVAMEKEFNMLLLQDVTHKLKLIKESIEETEHISVRITVLRGSLRQAIHLTIAEERPDIIVMGTIGTSGIKEKLWGTNVASVIGSTPVPVITVPYDYNWKKPQKMLLVTNHFEKERAILTYIFELANLYMARVEVAIFTDTDDDNAVTYLEHTRQIPQYEKMLQEEYQESTLVASQLYGPDFEDTLKEYIKTASIDMLVMITYKKREGMWSRFVHPSKTRQISNHMNIPVMAILYEAQND